MTDRIITRRSLLQWASAGAVGGLMAACVPTPAAPTPVPPTSPPRALTPVAAPKTGSALPSYIPLASKPKPDFPSKGELYEDGYLRFPTPPIKSAPAEPPGLGSTVTAFVDGLYPPATPVDQN